MDCWNFIGIRIEKWGSTEFYQNKPGLEEKMIQAGEMASVNGIHKPTTGEPVGADLDKPALIEEW